MRKRLYLLSHVAFLLLAEFIDREFSVAPEDFNRECDPFVSAYEPREKVLLDTQYYSSQSLLDVLGNSKKWLSLDLGSFRPSSSKQKVSDR